MSYCQANHCEFAYCHSAHSPNTVNESRMCRKKSPRATQPGGKNKRKNKLGQPMLVK